MSSITRLAAVTSAVPGSLTRAVATSRASRLRERFQTQTLPLETRGLTP